MFSNTADKALTLQDAMSTSLLSTIACALLVTGIFVVWSQWKKGQSSPLFLTLGWALVGLATPFWILLAGPEFGITIELILIAIIAWTFIFKNSDIKPLKPLTRSNSATINKNSKIKVSTQVILVTFLCPLASLLLTMLSGNLLPVALPSQLVFEALAFPFVWGLLAIWMCYTNRFWQTSAVIASLSVIFVAYLLW